MISSPRDPFDNNHQLQRCSQISPSTQSTQSPLLQQSNKTANMLAASHTQTVPNQQGYQSHIPSTGLAHFTGVGHLVDGSSSQSETRIFTAVSKSSPISPSTFSASINEATIHHQQHHNHQLRKDQHSSPRQMLNRTSEVTMLQPPTKLQSCGPQIVTMNHSITSKRSYFASDQQDPCACYDLTDKSHPYKDGGNKIIKLDHDSPFYNTKSREQIDQVTGPENSKFLIKTLYDLPVFVAIENFKVASYSIGGEKHLCLPQLLQYIKQDFPLEQVIDIFEETIPNFTTATPKQVEGFIKASALPPTANTCPLIKRSDADRVCLRLFDQYSRSKFNKSRNQPETIMGNVTVVGTSKSDDNKVIETEIEPNGRQNSRGSVGGTSNIEGDSSSPRMAGKKLVKKSQGNNCGEPDSELRSPSAANSSENSNYKTAREAIDLNKNNEEAGAKDEGDVEHLDVDGHEDFLSVAIGHGNSAPANPEDILEESGTTSNQGGPADDSNEHLFEITTQSTILDLARAATSMLMIQVYHRCFGKCIGLYYPSLLVDSESKCIECCICHLMLSPRRFVGHTHGSKEINVCHWGFNSYNWRKYIRLSRKQSMNNLDDDELLVKFRTLLSVENSIENQKLLGDRIDDSAIDEEDHSGFDQDKSNLTDQWTVKGTTARRVTVDELQARGTSKANPRVCLPSTSRAHFSSSDSNFESGGINLKSSIDRPQSVGSGGCRIEAEIQRSMLPLFHQQQQRQHQLPPMAYTNPNISSGQDRYWSEGKSNTMSQSMAPTNDIIRLRASSSRGFGSTYLPPEVRFAHHVGPNSAREESSSSVYFDANDKSASDPSAQIDITRSDLDIAATQREHIYRLGDPFLQFNFKLAEQVIESNGHRPSHENQSLHGPVVAVPTPSATSSAAAAVGQSDAKIMDEFSKDFYVSSRLTNYLRTKNIDPDLIQDIVGNTMVILRNARMFASGSVPW